LIVKNGVIAFLKFNYIRRIMLRLFQILSLAVLAGAVVLAAYVIKSPLPEDERVSGFLGKASIAEKYKNMNESGEGGAGSDSALVNAAKKYSAEPPAPAKQTKPDTTPRIKPTTTLSAVKTPTETVEKVVPPAPVNVKFKLVGTCVNRGNPAMSTAYIDMPGSGKKWVYEGENVGHLKLVKVKQESILLSDKGNMTELALNETKSVLKSILKEGTAGQGAVVEAKAVAEVEAVAAPAQAAPAMPLLGAMTEEDRKALADPEPVILPEIQALIEKEGSYDKVPEDMRHLLKNAPKPEAQKAAEPAQMPDMPSPEESARIMQEALELISKMNADASAAEPNAVKE
jgi:hypothetical protein